MVNKTFYRVCNNDSLQGLWYSYDGTFTGLIHNEFKFCVNNELKMQFDEEIVGWLSVADSLDALWHWFSQEDISNLEAHGWFIYEYEAVDVKFYDRFQHYIISQATSTVVRRIELEELTKNKENEKSNYQVFSVCIVISRVIHHQYDGFQKSISNILDSNWNIKWCGISLFSL